MIPMTTFHQNGGIERKYAIQNSRPTGLYQRWHENGVTYKKIFYNEDGLRHGPYMRWYESGQIHITASYKAGKLDGPYQEWHENGQTKHSTTYNEGKEDGLTLRKYANGEIHEKYTASNGEKNGTYEKWYDNGSPWQKITYKKNKKNGTFEKWDYSSEKIYMKCKYRDGKIRGPCEYLWSNGKKSMINYTKRYIRKMAE
jgi:antitoxin component YwqK of YwqJK toxin-antitoxin module